LFDHLLPKGGRRKSLAGSTAGLDKARLAVLKRFARTLRIPLGDGRLLNEALTHKSYAHESAQAVRRHNEKLEFLGDSVLGLIVSQHVYETYPDVTEGGLSKVKSVIVSAQILSEKAKEAGLGAVLLLGKGEERSGGRQRPALLADTLEAVIGAAYLTGGLKPAQELVLRLLREDIDQVFSGRIEKDHKTLLQEFYQKTQKRAPLYRVVREWGPDHNRMFEVACSLNGEVLATGTGKSKKEAEQMAAHEVIQSRNIVVSTPRDHQES